MRKRILTTILFLYSGNCYAQTERINIGTQANPVIHYNTYDLTSGPGYMKQWAIGKQTGVELNYRWNSRLTLCPAIKYYNRSQKIEQREFYGYLNAESKIWQKYNFESVDVGMLVKYALAGKQYNSLSVTVGFLYSIAALNKITGGYHLYGDNPKTAHLANIGYGFTPGDIGTRMNTWCPVIGMRKTMKVSKLGVFEYGVLFYFPLSGMPGYKYDQTIITDDAGMLSYQVGYKSKQYTTEVSLIYYLFNFGNGLKLTHPKRH